MNYSNFKMSALAILITCMMPLVASADILQSIGAATADKATQQQLQQQWSAVESKNAADSNATNAGNKQEINFNSPENSKVEYSGSQTVKNVPNVNSPPLVTSNDTCMGSASGGLSVAGFGVGLGKTYVDDNCVMLKNARELWNMGMRAAGLALLCTSDDNRYALEVTGYDCPLSKKEWIALEKQKNADLAKLNSTKAKDKAAKK